MHGRNWPILILHDSWRLHGSSCLHNERTRRTGIEVLEIIDRAVEQGVLPPAPAEKACAFCDFRPVCGPEQERGARLSPTTGLKISSS